MFNKEDIKINVLEVYHSFIAEVNHPLLKSPIKIEHSVDWGDDVTPPFSDIEIIDGTEKFLPSMDKYPEFKDWLFDVLDEMIENKEYYISEEVIKEAERLAEEEYNYAAEMERYRNEY